MQKYTVETTKFGMTVNSDNGHTRTYAIELAKKTAATCSEDEQVFVIWYRKADGCKGYLNPDGNHAITGKSW